MISHRCHDPDWNPHSNERIRLQKPRRGVACRIQTRTSRHRPVAAEKERFGSKISTSHGIAYFPSTEYIIQSLLPIPNSSQILQILPSPSSPFITIAPHHAPIYSLLLPRCTSPSPLPLLIISHNPESPLLQIQLPRSFCLLFPLVV